MSVAGKSSHRLVSTCRASWLLTCMRHREILSICYATALGIPPDPFADLKSRPRPTLPEHIINEQEQQAMDSAFEHVFGDVAKPRSAQL